MKTIVMILVAFVHEIVLSRATLQLENVALRQQVAVLKRERPRPGVPPFLEMEVVPRKAGSPANLEGNT